MRKILAVIALVAVVFVAYEWLTWPDVEELVSSNPETTAFMKRRERELRSAGNDAEIRQTWVSYERISPSLRRAVVVSEDSAFFEHEGYDRKELEESVKRNLRERRLTRGGSTITQQLAKNLWLSPSKNPYRKVKELLLARQLEKTLSKQRILEIYLNVVELGETIYGVEAASQHYFGKSARNLATREAALLAGALPNPRSMNPGDPNARLRARQKIILSRMKRWGSAVDEELQRPAGREPSPPAAEPSEAPVADAPEAEEPLDEPAETEEGVDEELPSPVDDPAAVETGSPEPPAEGIEPNPDPGLLPD